MFSHPNHFRLDLGMKLHHIAKFLMKERHCYIEACLMFVIFLTTITNTVTSKIPSCVTVSIAVLLHSCILTFVICKL